MRKKDVTSLFRKDDAQVLSVNLVYLADGKVATFPLYRKSYVKPLHCSRHARLAANQFFGRNYNIPASAWDLRYVYETIPATNLGEQFDNEELGSGDLVGFFNTSSPENNLFDREGNVRKYTHIALCIGRTLTGRLVFGEQYVTQRRVVGLGQLMARHNKPVEIIKDRLRTI